MKNKLIIFILCIGVLVGAVGCGVSRREIPTDGAAGMYLRDVNGAPDKAPALRVIIIQDNSPETSFVAIQLGTSWMINFEDGTGTGYESDSPHALQLGTGILSVATIHLDEPDGIVEFEFSNNFPPDLISVKRWDEKNAASTGRDVSNIIDKGEAVEVTGNIIKIADDGNDYIYEVYASWRHNGNSRYAFRFESAG